MIAPDYKQLGLLRAEAGLRASANTGYQVRVSNEAEDPNWDAFLTKVPGGHHTQTSLWARVKAPFGWRAARIVVTRAEQIVAGAQLLMRRLPIVGAIGYVPRGPLFTLDDPALTTLVMAELLRLAGTHRVQYLSVQPPCNGEALGHQLLGWGFRESIREVEPTATILLDLSKDPEELLAQMKRRTRYRVRLGPRKGITVREGTESDIPTFYRLLLGTGERQNFSTCPEEYFLRMWHILAPHGYAKLFLADYEGEPVSALFVVPFGSSVNCWRAAWSGHHAKRRPNEAIQWAAINWSKSQGYRYYDFEGIDPKAARELTRGWRGEQGERGEVPSGSQAQKATLRSASTETVAFFKLGFGGQIALSPGAYDYVPNPLLRWAYAAVVPKTARWPVVSKVENFVRGIRHDSLPAFAGFMDRP